MCGGAQRHEWRFHLPRPGVIAILDRMGDCPVPSYAYKWEANTVHHPDGRMAKIKRRDFRAP